MPINIFSGLIRGPAAYRPMTGWHPLAAVLAGLAIYVIAAAASTLLTTYLAELSGTPVRVDATASAPSFSPYDTGSLFLILVMQAMLIVLILIACTFFKGSPRQVLALHTPKPNYAVVLPALFIVLAGVLIYCTIAAAIFPNQLFQDVEPFIKVVNSDDVALLTIAAVIGAPLSEEFLFRGFLLSALAKTKIGFAGAALATTAAWAALHGNYSALGLGVVFITGLTLSWLLWRTGSLWVPIFCHAVYNGLIVAGLSFLELPT